MTEEEKDRVAKVLSRADGHCSNCAIRQSEAMKKEFPEEDWYSRVMSHYDRWQEYLDD